MAVVLTIPASRM